MPFRMTYRKTLAWTMLTGSIFALIGLQRSIVGVVISLVLLGLVGGFWAAYEHGWIHGWKRGIVGSFLICGVMGIAGWLALPPFGTDALKAETVKLSSDIVHFMGERESVKPVISGHSPDYRALSEQWGNRTVGDYISNFDSRIIALGDQYKAEGIDTSDIEAMCLRPANAWMISHCAKEIQVLSAKLPRSRLRLLFGGNKIHN